MNHVDSRPFWTNKQLERAADTAACSYSFLAGAASSASGAAEAAQNTKDRGDPPLEDGDDAWSAAECVALEMVACEVDRKVDLSPRYLSAEDDSKLRIKLSGELRLPALGEPASPPSRGLERCSELAI